MAVGSGSRRAGSDNEVWISGLGVVSSLGEGAAEHLHRLAIGAPGVGAARIDETSFSPYVVHPLAGSEFADVPKADARQMGAWQRIGVHAAALALADAGLADHSVRAQMHLNVAAGNGERDPVADNAVLEALGTLPSAEDASLGPALNAALKRVLRPTLYLAELSNLLAGNISIVHGVTGSSRTFKGEEMAGVSAVADAVSRIRSGTGELFLVGGACNAERADLMLNLELCGVMWHGAHASVWERAARGGGIVLGSVGAFLVLESAARARTRGRRPYAALSDVASGPGDTAIDGPCADLTGPVAVLSGASGAEPATTAEAAWLDRLEARGLAPSVRAYGTMLGHGVEAHFPLGIALGALALSRNELYPPFDATGRELPHTARLDRVLVTARGQHRGAGLGRLEAVRAQ